MATTYLANLKQFTSTKGGEKLPSILGFNSNSLEKGKMKMLKNKLDTKIIKRETITEVLNSTGAANLMMVVTNLRKESSTRMSRYK